MRPRNIEVAAVMHYLGLSLAQQAAMVVDGFILA
jgi:hypothetical protein